MPKRIGPGGPWLQSAQLDAPSLADEDSDSWWSGVALNVVSVPRASTAAALALSVAIAGSFAFNDDIVPQPSVVESGLQRGERALYTPTLKQWEFVDELPQQQTFVGDDDSWSAVQSPQPVVARAFSVDDEIVPPPVALRVDEDYWLAPQPELPRPVLRDFSFNDEIEQAPTSVAFAEAGFAQLRLHTPSLKQWEFADDLPQAVVPDQQDSFSIAAIGAAPQPMVFAADEEIVPAAAPLGVDEIYNWSYVPQVVPPLVTLWRVEDERPTPSAPLGVDEADWQVHTPRAQAPQPLYLPDPDQAVPASLAITEAEWQVYSPPWPASQPLYLPDPEEALPSPLSIVEPEWQIYSPPWAKPQPLYLPDPEQAVPLSLFVDEMYWQVYTPAPLAPLVTLFKDEPVALAGWVVPPVYGWGARGRVGSTSARDPNSSIGTSTAVDPNKPIGSEKA